MRSLPSPNASRGLGAQRQHEPRSSPFARMRPGGSSPKMKGGQFFEERSHHIAVGLEYLPAVSRRLHHGHDLGEPFDFLTWFEYSPEDANAFEELVRRLRQTPEWRYVDREVENRLSRI